MMTSPMRSCIGNPTLFLALAHHRHWRKRIYHDGLRLISNHRLQQVERSRYFADDLSRDHFLISRKTGEQSIITDVVYEARDAFGGAINQCYGISLEDIEPCRSCNFQSSSDVSGNLISF